MIKTALSATLAMLMLNTFALAQVRVTKSMTDASLLDISGFKSAPQGASATFRTTLEANLVRSGWFKIITAGRGEFTVIGSVEERDGQLVVQCEAYNVMTRERHLGQSYRAPAADARRLAHRVADDIIKALTGRDGISSTQIAMVGSRTGHKELYICDADGGNLRQITRDGSLSMSPKWSPDARQIVYTSFLSFFPDVYMLTLATGERRRIANYPGLNSSASISPDGREMALTLSKDGSPNIYIKDLRSGRLTRLTNARRAAEASPSWSPDGRRLVFVSDVAGSPQLYIIDRRGGEPRRITSHGSQNVDPDWGSNGFIAYCSRIDRQYQIVVMDPETQRFRQISSGAGDFEDPSWAPDGRHIVCTRTINRRSRLFVLDTMTGSCISLLPDSVEGDWFSPAWSPR